MQKETQSQLGYQIFNIDELKVRVLQDTNKYISLQIISLNTSKIYRSENIQLKNINTDTLKAGLNKTNQSIQILFEEKEQKLLFKILIQVPLLPTIIQNIYCSYSQTILDEFSNKLCLLDIRNKFLKTKQLLDSYKDKSKLKSINIISIDEIAQLYQYNQYDDYNDEYHNNDEGGIIQIAHLNIQQQGKYLVTLSFLVANLGEFYFYHGRNDNPIGIFNTYGEEYICGQKDPSNYYCYSLRDTIFISNQTKNFRLFTYESGNGTYYRNIVLTLEKLDY